MKSLCNRHCKTGSNVLPTLCVWASLSFCIVFGAAPKLAAQPSSSLAATLTPPAIPASPRAYLPLVEGAGLPAPRTPSPTAVATATMTGTPTPSPTPSLAATAWPSPTPTPTRFRLSLGGMKSYWGDLHQHSAYSGDEGHEGTGAPSVHYEAARDGEVDFLALTEYEGVYARFPERWDSLGEIADSYNEDGVFVALRGFEWMSTRGHINVYNTDTRAPRMPVVDFYDWLASQPGSLAAFNHPSRMTPDGQQWDLWDFAYHAGADQNLVTIEADPTYGDPPCRYECMYQAALYAGWHVGPVGYSDIHDPVDDPLTESNKGYGIMAPHLTREDLFDALRARRTFISMDEGNLAEDGDLAIAMRVNGVWMGSSLPWSDTLDFEIVAGDGSGDQIAEMELVRGGPCGLEVVATEQPPDASHYTWRLSRPADGGYYYARVTLDRKQEGQDRYLQAFTAPVWLGQQAACPPGCEQLPPIPAQEDTYIEAWDGGETNHGADRSLQVRSGGVKAALLRFDLSSVPPGATVTGAKLYLYSADEGGPRNQYVTAYPVRRSWVAGETTWTHATAADLWGEAGCYGADDYGERGMVVVEVRPEQAEYGFPYAFDVTQMVLDWVAEPESNFGLLLRGCAGYSVEYQFISSDWSSKPSEQPRLEICYLPSLPTTPSTSATASSSTSPPRISSWGGY